MYTDYTLPVKLTPDKKAQLEQRNTEIDIALLVEQEKLTEARAEHKANTNLTKDEKKRNLNTVRQGYEMLNIKAMEYINEDEGTIEYVDEDGVKIHERSLSLEERRQYRIQFGRKQIVD